MFLAALLGIAYLGLALTKVFRKEVELPDRIHYFASYYANQVFYYTQMVAAVQGWIFAVRYWLSATVSSMSETWFTVLNVKRVGWAVGILYILIQTVFFLIKTIEFPQYYDENGS